MDTSDLTKLFQSGINMITSEITSKKSFPVYDIFYNDILLLIVFEIPGINKKDIKLDFFNDMLTIKGNKKKYNNLEVFQGEIDYGYFERTIKLPLSITSQNNVSTNVENGLLIININVKKESENKFSINL